MHLINIEFQLGIKNDLAYQSHKIVNTNVKKVNIKYIHINSIFLNIHRCLLNERYDRAYNVVNDAQNILSRRGVENLGLVHYRLPISEF